MFFSAFKIEYHVFVFMCECVFDVGFYEIIVSGVLCFVLFCFCLYAWNFMYVKVKIINFYRG